jgi:hypothetical protein
MSYRQSPAFRAAVLAAAVQRRNMHHRVAMLENVRTTPLVLPSRRFKS